MKNLFRCILFSFYVLTVAYAKNPDYVSYRVNVAPLDHDLPDFNHASSRHSIHPVNIYISYGSLIVEDKEERKTRRFSTIGTRSLWKEEDPSVHGYLQLTRETGGTQRKVIIGIGRRIANNLPVLWLIEKYSVTEFELEDDWSR